jgi:hypothetical protein
MERVPEVTADTVIVVVLIVAVTTATDAVEVSKFPSVPGATKVTFSVSLPITTLLRVSVASPVPPLATGKVPVMPVVSGSPVALVNTPEAGVPSAGVTKVGLVDRTTLPEPVEVATPVPPLITGTIPVKDVSEVASKSEPVQTAMHLYPAGMVIPVVGPTPTSLMLCVLDVLLITT